MNYLTMQGFVEVVKISGVDYVVIKKRDNDLYLYHILKNENGKLNQVYRCDKKPEYAAYFKALRMDARDAAIQARRESLHRKGINAFTKHTGNMKQIFEAYKESINC